jgi:O-phosphoseryl-tRNA(Cys) synthetase
VKIIFISGSKLNDYLFLFEKLQDLSSTTQVLKTHLNVGYFVFIGQINKKELNGDYLFLIDQVNKKLS